MAFHKMRNTFHQLLDCFLQLQSDKFYLKLSYLGTRNVLFSSNHIMTLAARGMSIITLHSYLVSKTSLRLRKPTLFVLEQGPSL